jgi:hypothetical protein
MPGGSPFFVIKKIEVIGHAHDSHPQMTIALTTLNQFSIGVERSHDGLCEDLCTITTTTPITPRQLQDITDMFDFYVKAVLPFRVQVDDFLNHIRSIIGNGATIKKSPNICYYGNNVFCQDCTHVTPLFTILYNNQHHHHEFNGDLNKLETFLKTVRVM